MPNIHPEDFVYTLPQSLIATEPHSPADEARLLLVDASNGHIRHKQVCDLPDLLPAASLVVVNNTRVMPSRLIGQRLSGARLEALLLRECRSGVWEALMKNSAKVKIGEELLFCDGNLEATLLEKEAEVSRLDFGKKTGELLAVLEAHGLAPLPPYILKQRAVEGDPQRDRHNYQSCFAREYGAVAAPTASLHFTQRLLQSLPERDIEVVEVTLDVGYGTFQKVSEDNIRNKRLHSERYRMSPATAQAINTAKREGRAVVAIGTTALRVLETLGKSGVVQAGEGETDLFIYPPYEFQVVDLLFTNFHHPQSSLLMLVSAFLGQEWMAKAYQIAIQEKYRFMSFGDASLLIRP